jgi:inner membrane protein
VIGDKRDEGDRAMTLEPNATPQRRLRYPAMVELIILGGLVLVLMVGLLMIGSLVSERMRRAESVRAEIASSWGQSQTIGGPVVVVPFRLRYTGADGRVSIIENRARFLPEHLRVSGRLIPERRHRGIFETVVYRADLTLQGDFGKPDFSAWNVAPEDVLWSEAVVTVGVPDLRGIHGAPALKWNEGSVAFSGGTGDAKLWATGLTASAPMSPASDRYDFSVKLELNGSERIAFLPLGGETIVDLSSPWPDPSFGGAFLPEQRSVTASGFTARWRVSSLARSYPQRWSDNVDEATSAFAAVGPSAFDVGLFTPVSHYQQTERSMKYGVLFIVLTYLTFFLYELLSPVTLHPVQYFLVGGALCLFYLLLLSISEQARFGVAYAIATAATVGLISLYSAALLHSRLRVAGLTAVLSFLYGYLYVLLQLEDWALLMGSIGLFLILALVMYTTRKVDWGSAHQERVVS